MIFIRNLHLLFFSTALVFCSCKGLNGRIDIRGNGCDDVPDSKQVYLVNTSKTQKYEFTVKSIETINDTLTTYSTQIITLAPGDEEYLGCDLYYYEKKYLITEKREIINLDTSQIYQYKENLFSKKDIEEAATRNMMTIDEYIQKVPDLKMIPLYDTLINNTPLKYKKNFVVDSLKFVLQNKHSIKYEVTGQSVPKRR